MQHGITVTRLAVVSLERQAVVDTVRGLREAVVEVAEVAEALEGPKAAVHQESVDKAAAHQESVDKAAVRQESVDKAAVR